jgi:hypothetical protein
VGAGFLCEPGDSVGCPAVAKSTNGDSYELTGAGTFDTVSKSVKAAGTFNHKSPSGNVLETGVWTASELLSFDSYGAAPTALQQKGPAFGSPQLGPKRVMAREGAVPTGGLAILRILLVPLSGPPQTAMLQVNCALGDVPKEHSVEGIRITVESRNAVYPEETSGRVMFLSKRPETSVSGKTHPEESEPQTPAQPQL